ncbi:hypothetical protein SprV_0100254300 [Sparganum proliferum]
MPINTTHNPDTPRNTNTATVNTSDEDRVYACPHCDRTFNSHTDLVAHLRIYRTETGEPVPGTPTYTRRIGLHRPHCPRTFMHRMGLFGHMRIHESGIDHSPDTPSTYSTPIMPSPVHIPPPGAPTATSSITLSTSCTPTTLSPTHTPSPSVPTTATTSSTIAEPDTDTADFSCPHCPRTFTSHTGLVHRTETDQPVPGAPTYTRCIRLHCLPCTRTFIHRKGLLDHMRVHKNPW